MLRALFRSIRNGIVVKRHLILETYESVLESSHRDRGDVVRGIRDPHDHGIAWMVPWEDEISPSCSVEFPTLSDHLGKRRVSHRVSPSSRRDTVRVVLLVWALLMFQDPKTATLGVFFILLALLAPGKKKR